MFVLQGVTHALSKIAAEAILPVVVAGFVLASWQTLALSAPAGGKRDKPVVCKAFDDDESDEDETPDSRDKSGGKDKGGEGVYFDFGGACANFSGSVSFNHQNNLRTSASGLPVLIGPNGKPSNSRIVNSVSATARLETRRKVAAGDLETALSTKWTKSSDDEQGTAGTFTIDEVTASLAGVTVGYTDSLMNFWSGDFQFTASAPSRTVGTLTYEQDINDDWKAAFAIESGLPTSREAAEGIRSVEFNSPLLTARLRYEKDDVELHVSGLVRRAEFPANPLIPFLPPTATTRTGWAASVGATLPLEFIAKDDTVSTQATYAVDASPFLGTAVDLSTLASTVPTTGPTRGWSVVTSFHHVWSEQWESNLFGSYLALDAELIRAQPTVRTKRFGANLYWLPSKSLKFGAEIGYVDTRLAANGALGFLSGVSGEAYVGYLSAEWKF